MAQFLISYGGSIRNGDKSFERTFAKVLRTKKISRFHNIAVVEVNLAEGLELCWFCNARPIAEKIAVQEPQRGKSPYYPKETLLWGDYTDGCNPYVIAIPINGDFTWQDAMSAMNTGLDSFLRSNKQPAWAWQEERAYKLPRKMWSLSSDIELGLSILGLKAEAEAATKGKGGSAYDEAFASFKSKALEAVKKALA